MADVLTWDALYERFVGLFGQQDYQGAYDLLSDARDQLPDQVEAVDYYRVCALARMGENERVFRMLDEKLASGFWYSEFLMRSSPSFAPLQGDAEFERLVALNVERADAETSGGGLIVHTPQGASQPYPTIIALHGNAQGNREASDAWKPAAEQGWLVAVPQSSMMVWKGSAMWDDYERAVSDVTHAYQQLGEQHAIDTNRLILGGFSMGGQTAIQMALEAKLPARGFIVLGPGGPGMDNPEETFAPLLEGAAARGLRGYIALGDADHTIPQEAIRRLVSMMNAAGIPCGYESLPGLAHDYPENFAEIVARAVAFIEQ